ncbi:MAG: hypothetical protein CM1200mP28_16060 [Deltaproteobacteria bacterium]|nr:MAG: hypothetical protein CM1200mP28_16060 [Deltaproteobacteria bacterium]
MQFAMREADQHEWKNCSTNKKNADKTPLQHKPLLDGSPGYVDL